MTSDRTEPGTEELNLAGAPGGRRGPPRQLNGDERVSFTICALYLGILGLSAFLFSHLLVLRVVGAGGGALGAALLYVAVFNPGKAPREHSPFTKKWYLMAVFSTLASVFVLREVVTRTANHLAAISIIYGTLTALFLIFRRAMIQTLMLVVSLVFIGVLAANWGAAVSGEMGFVATLRKSGQAVFRAGPFREVANTLAAGPFMNYLGKVDYRDERINFVATRKVLESGDDALRKTRALLDFVSNEIQYITDPNDGVEFTKAPRSTLASGGGDCEDQTVLLCSLLESVGVKTYMAFTADHVFAFARLGSAYPELEGVPRVVIDGQACFMIDPADPGARIGYGAARIADVREVFDVQSKHRVNYAVPPAG